MLMLPFRALQGRLYDRGGSLFIVGVLHAVGDATGSGGFDAGLPPRLYPDHAGDASLLPIAAQVLIGLCGASAKPARSPIALVAAYHQRRCLATNTSAWPKRSAPAMASWLLW
jgi:hypothetical protein